MPPKKIDAIKTFIKTKDGKFVSLGRPCETPLITENSEDDDQDIYLKTQRNLRGEISLTCELTEEGAKLLNKMIDEFEKNKKEMERSKTWQEK